MPNYFKNIRNALVGLVLLVIFPAMVGVIFYTLSAQRREARQQAQETALRIARLSAREQERLITGAHHLLMTLAELPEIRERKAAECNRLFAGIFKKFPYYTNLAAVTPQGDIFCSGLPNVASQPNIADRAYFQEALKERRLGISHVLVGRMSGKPSIAIAYPSFDPGGSVHAVVFVGLDLDWLNHVAATAHLPARARLLALDEKSKIFVRYTEDGDSHEPLSANAALVETIITQKEGFTEAVGSDGVRRLFAFTTLHRLAQTGALFVAVGIPEEVAFASSKRILHGSLIVLLIAALLAGAGTWLGADLFIRRKMDKVVAAARALGDGVYDELAAAPSTLESAAGQFEQVVHEMRLALRKATGRHADLTAMIAHDLRNPLQTIHCAAALLPQGGQTPQTQLAYIGMIRRGCEELTQTLNEFLDFSKYRAGYLQLEKGSLDISEFFDDLEAQYRWRAQQKNIRLKLEVEPQRDSISADRKKLHQLMDNLLSNALKFTSAQGEIRIGARPAQDGIELWVTDNGVGIAQEDMKSLFSLYGQTDSARSSGEKGTGLGLLICKMIAEAHGGRISVQSELGSGTIFRVWLPRASAACLAADGPDRAACPS
jgi:signal transduction histidine kinase